MMAIPTYITNLAKRSDRRAHILKEFANKPEFKVQLIKAIENKNGALGLWQTITHIINLAPQEADYILICEDDHQFTANYSSDKLAECIKEAEEKNADILNGGPSWFNSALPISNNLFWVETFTGTQFIIVFKKFFKNIIETDFNLGETFDFKVCALTQNIFFIYPFISTQKEFGYSDATHKNNIEQRVEELFNKCSEKAQLVQKLLSHYKKQQEAQSHINKEIDNITIPTYIINLPERTERKAHILAQFANRKEFEVTIIEACKHKIGAVGLWLSIIKIIQMAKANEDDVIIICEDDHQFTESYTKEFLISNIVEAHEQGVEYMSGGTSQFDLIIPITRNRYWTSHSLATQFIIIYSKFFEQILEEPFDEEVIADMLLSEMSPNKMLLYPFISIQKDFGYSDITSLHNDIPNFVTSRFQKASIRITNIHAEVEKYRILDK